MNSTKLCLLKILHTAKKVGLPLQNSSRPAMQETLLGRRVRQLINKYEVDTKLSEKSFAVCKKVVH